MIPEQKIKQWIMCNTMQAEDAIHIDSEEITEENVDEMYRDGEWDEGDFRSGEMETDIPSEYSRHYESKSVAAKMCDGSWVGWTYWYGGGKYGEPGSISWMEDAYELDVTEEEKLIVVRTFRKKETPSA